MTALWPGSLQMTSSANSSMSPGARLRITSWSGSRDNSREPTDVLLLVYRSA